MRDHATSTVSFQIWYACAYLGEPEALVERHVEPGALEALRLHALLVGVGVLARLPPVHRRRPRGQAEVLECMMVFKLQGYIAVLSMTIADVKARSSL